MPFDTDYSGQLNEMLAPYQEAAKKLTSPYATMSQDSWLVQNHPKLAGVLDNAFLTAGMVPSPQGPEGVGGGISRTMQGLIGAKQFHRNQALQAAMLPYQMLEPRLKMEDTIAQMHQRSAQAEYESKRGAWYDKRVDQMDNPHALGASLTDDSGGKWHEVFDPVQGTTRLFNPITQKHADELPADKQPSFVKSQRAQRSSTPGGLAGMIIEEQMDADPAIKAHGEQAAKLYTGLMGSTAGARKGGEQDAPHTFDESKMMLENERKSVYGKLPNLQNEEQYRKSLNPTQLGEYYSDPGAYQKYQEKYGMQKDQLDFNFAQYQRSGAWKHGIGFQEWIKNPDAAEAAAPPTASTNSGTKWTPKR